MKTTKVVLQTRTIKRTSVIGNLKKHWQLFFILDSSSFVHYYLCLRTDDGTANSI